MQLAGQFNQLICLDPGREQIENAVEHPQIAWLCAAAENIPLNNHSVDLIVAAQSAHWFDRPAFYAEARRIAVPGAVIALVSYGVLHLEGNVLIATEN